MEKGRQVSFSYFGRITGQMGFSHNGHTKVYASQILYGMEQLGEKNPNLLHTSAVRKKIEMLQHH